MRNTKGREYSHEGDRLANFKRIASELDIDPLIVCWVYFKKHVDSIASYVKEKREGLSEPVRGRIVDAITYLGLLNGLIEESTKTFYLPPVKLPDPLKPPRCENTYGGRRCMLLEGHSGKHQR
jgi:hypothetical protein